ncbi:MAG: hypothetical protein AAFQ82_26340 [Myxococcota bacterium]
MMAEALDRRELEQVSTRAVELGLAPPPAHLKWLEARVFLEAPALFLAAPLLFAQPRGRGQRVVVIPGLLFGERSTRVLRTYLRLMGYRAEDWGLGVNRGRPEQDAEKLVSRFEQEGSDEPLMLVGWSLGGVIARLVAMGLGKRVPQLITMGTPVEGGPKYTAVARPFAKRAGINLDELEAHVHVKNQIGLQCDVTAIYSKSDGVVGWKAAIDRHNPQTIHRQIPGSHIGLGVNPWAFRVIAQTLAENGRAQESLVEGS